MVYYRQILPVSTNPFDFTFVVYSNILWFIEVCSAKVLHVCFTQLCANGRSEFSAHIRTPVSDRRLPFQVNQLINQSVYQVLVGVVVVPLRRLHCRYWRFMNYFQV